MIIDIDNAAVDNADKRLKEIHNLDFAIAAIADYDNGLTQGFKDGAIWMHDELMGKIYDLLMMSFNGFKNEHGRPVEFVNKVEFIDAFISKLDDK